MKRIISSGARRRRARQYPLVEALARQTPGLLLLTATPQQLGPEGHFARLRLLDPGSLRGSRSVSSQEAEHYEQVAQAIDRLLAGKTADERRIASFSRQNPRASGAALRGAGGGRCAARASGSSPICSMNSARAA